MKPFRYISITIIYMFGLLTARADNQALKRALSTLDRAIAESPTLRAEKEQRIAAIEDRLRDPNSAFDNADLIAQAYAETLVYDGERALRYADLAINAARAHGDSAGCAKWRMKRAFVMAKTEQVREAREYLESVDITLLDTAMQSEYYATMAAIFAHFGRFSSHEYTQRYYARSHNYEDSCVKLLPDNHPGKLCARAKRAVDDKERRELCSLLKAVVDTAALDSRTDAQNAYVLGTLYKQLGEADSAQVYLAKSAIADIAISNKDIMSLLELSAMRLEAGDTHRALTYVSYTLDLTQQYGSIHHLNELLSLENTIAKTIDRQNAARHNRHMVLLAVVIVLSLVLIVALIILWRRNRLLMQARHEVTEAHDTLVTANDQIQKANNLTAATNARLEEANFVKQRCINTMFALCSDYIDRMERQRKETARRIKAGQIDELRRSVTSPGRTQSDLKDFYKAFDRIVLDIFPDFVDRFNELLRPEERTYPKDGELLNTTLRIHALIRLGINDSVTIAAMLHCSVQTIYNKRMKTRQKAIGDRNELAAKIRTLCAP